jgi:hypothetical protein
MLDEQEKAGDPANGVPVASTLNSSWTPVYDQTWYTGFPQQAPFFVVDLNATVRASPLVCVRGVVGRRTNCRAQ